MFMIAMAIALVGYVVFPTAPPRFMPEWGFIDSVSDVTGVHVSHASATASALFNPYAAVPSMHVAFALMVGWPLARLVRPWASCASSGLLYPFLMAFVIVATANHFITDALARRAHRGSRRLRRALARADARPGVWRFSSLASTQARLQQQA